MNHYCSACGKHIKTGSLHTVNTLASSEPALNEGGIRWTIFNHKQELIDCGAIFLYGKKLLIDRDRFIEYMKSQNESPD
jgi:hypothetical protein